MESRKPTRREALAMLGAAGVAAAVGCGSGGSAAGPSTPSGCGVAPTETLGPYPSLSELVRSDIREGLGGLPLTLTVHVVNAGNACSPVAGAVVDIWQCDAQGRYSEYAQPGYDGRGETFLRGVQTTDATGLVTFTTIYPGWYRATHIHVEVSMNGRSVKVTQIAFPENVTAAVYSRGVYASKGQNPTPNSSDSIFADSLAAERATLTGDTTNGYRAAFRVGISV